MHTHISNLSMSTLCICHPHFAFFMHIAPLAEEAFHPEPEPIIQEPGEEPVVLQPPQEEQLYEEPQQEYAYVPETTGELTTDPSEQGRHLKHYPMQIVSHRSV